MENLRDLIIEAKRRENKRIAVACAGDHEVILAVQRAVSEQIADFILVGDEDKIKAIANEVDFNLTNTKIIHETEKDLACEIAVKLVSSGEADILMKGLVNTSVLLKQVLNKEYGLRTGNVLSHTMVLDLPMFNRLIFLSDGGMNISPDEETLKQIIENSVSVARCIGVDEPKVACISAIEKVNPKMPSTVLCRKMQELNESGIIKNCIVAGPMAVDNAISEESAKIKGITHPVAGCADILIVPYIEVGNALYKGWVFGSENVSAAGVVVGAQKPIILTSRADSDETKLNAIALSVLM